MTISWKMMIDDDDVDEEDDNDASNSINSKCNYNNYI